VSLSDALRDPNDVATLLLLELEERVEDAVVELLHERVDVQLHLIFKELVLEGLLPRVGAGALEALLVLAVVFGHLTHLVVVIGSGQGLEAVGVQPAAGGVKLLPVVLRQLRPERVDRDDKCPPVRLEGEDLAHDVGRLAPDVLAKVVEGLQVGFVQGVANNLDVHLIKILFVNAGLEEGR